VAAKVVEVAVITSLRNPYKAKTLLNELPFPRGDARHDQVGSQGFKSCGSGVAYPRWRRAAGVADGLGRLHTKFYHPILVLPSSDDIADTLSTPATPVAVVVLTPDLALQRRIKTPVQSDAFVNDLIGVR
jgi:hypothetical protein